MDELRKRLEAVFGEIPEALWNRISREGYDEAYANAETDRERRDAYICAVDYLKQLGLHPRRASSESTAYTSDALSRAFVAVQWGQLQRILNAPEEALTRQARALRDAILGFRAKYLPEGVIPEACIPQWLREHQYASTFWAKIALPEVVWQEVMNALLQNRPVEYTLTLTRETVRELSADTPTLRYEGRAYCVPSELLRAVQAVQDATGWAEEQAVRFVLADSMPKGLPIQYWVQWKPTTGITFLTLRLPLFLEADTVEGLYRKIRKQAHASRRRLQGIHERQAALIRFVEEYRVRHPQARWREVAQAWDAHRLQQGYPEGWRISESKLSRHYNEYIHTVLELVRGSPVGMLPTGDDSGT